MTTVDISRWQGVISVATFTGWRQAGVTRVIIKLGGGDDGRYKDSCTDQNHANALAAGMLVEGYWFNGTTDPAGDARFAASIARPGERIWFDVESEGSMPHWTPYQLNTAARAAVALGHPVGGYMSSSVTFAADWSSCTWLPLWVANYSSSSAPSVGYWSGSVLWQRTSTGHLPGYGGNLDIDVDLTTSEATSATPIPGGFLMSLDDTQQRQIYEALVDGGATADAFYKTDAIINILRGELAPLIQAAADALTKPSSYSGGFRPIDVLVSQVPAILAAVSGQHGPLTDAQIATLAANLKAGLGDEVASDLAQRLATKPAAS